MADRYYSPTPIVGPAATLSGSEAHHLVHVLRAKPGAEVTLFDGSGGEFLARVTRVGKHEVELELIERREVDRESPREIALAVALPKGERQQWLVEKCTELGVHRLAPIVTRRGVAQPVQAALERLRRGVIEASKQCGRNRLMEIGEPLDWEEFVSGSSDDVLRVIAHPAADGLKLGELIADPRPVAAAIGPEGGFTDQEIALALERGWQGVSLGPRILRVETAAIVLGTLASG